LRDIAAHPGRTLARLPRKVLALYKGDVDGFWYQGRPDRGNWYEAGVYHGWAWWVLVGAQLYYMAIVLVFAAAVLDGARLGWLRHAPRRTACETASGPAPLPKPWRIPPLPLALIAYFTLIYLVYFGIMRFHYPIVPWMVLIGSGWLARCFLEHSINAERRAGANHTALT
jgi:hypothetical protein